MKRLTLFLLVAILLFSFSCEKKSTGPITQKPSFTIYGAVVKDLNLSKDIAAFTVSRNDTLYNGAAVKVSNKSIPNVGSGVYYNEFSDTTFHARTAYIDSIVSSQDTVTITFGFTMPGSFSINPLSSTDSLNRAGHAVTVSWTPSDSSSGYFISVVKGDSITGAALYSATLSGTYGAIPRDAFHTSADVLVMGYYWIYVTAYNKSFPSYPGIPFNLPAGLPANNISGAQGTIGAGVIAQKAVIYVTTSP